MCTSISGDHVAPGYICCQCSTYNGLWREQCKYCQRSACEVLGTPAIVPAIATVEQLPAPSITRERADELLADLHEIFRRVDNLLNKIGTGVPLYDLLKEIHANATPGAFDSAIHVGPITEKLSALLGIDLNLLSTNLINRQRDHQDLQN